MRTGLLSRHRGGSRAVVFVSVVATLLLGAGIGAQPVFAYHSTNNGCVYNDGTLLGRSIYATASIDTGTPFTMSSSAASYASGFVGECSVYLPSNAIDLWMQAQVSPDQVNWSVCDTKGPYVLNDVGAYWIAQQTFNDCGHGLYYRAWVCAGVLYGGTWKTGCLYSGDALAP
jgi:hypothetical protein